MFALLLAAAIVLILLGIPEGAGASTAEVFTDPARRKAVQTALALMPFVGILFLRLAGAVQAMSDRWRTSSSPPSSSAAGWSSRPRCSGAAAAAASVLAHPSGAFPDPSTWDFGRYFAYTLMTEYAMRMAAVFSCSISVIGMGVLPRSLSMVGFLTDTARRSHECPTPSPTDSSLVPWS